MKRKVVLAMVVAFLCATLTACNDTEVTELKNIEALDGEFTVVNNNMSVNEREAAVYAQVSNRTLLDLTLLEPVAANDKTAVQNYMELVNQQLTGVVKASNGVIDECYTDYLLMLFERTPYYWQRASMNIRGMDSESRSIIVDMTYRTIDFDKNVLPKNLLPRGCNAYDLQTQARYERWIELLKIKYEDLDWAGYNETDNADYVADISESYIDKVLEEHKGNTDESSITVDGGMKLSDLRAMSELHSHIKDNDKDGVPDHIDKKSKEYLRYEQLLQDFIEHYGDPDDIIEAQRKIGLTDYVFGCGNQCTYEGLINSAEEKSAATMTVRFVLVPEYTLGINQGYSCKHMYLLDYTLDNDTTLNRETYNEDGSATIVDSVYNTIYRYFTCADEDDFSGLCTLSTDFGSLDKYYEDYFETTYRKHDDFTMSLFSVAGTRIECGVTVSEKERAKGSNMTLPIYKNRYYVVLDLQDGVLKVSDIVLLSSVIEGEPTINAESVETSGFNSSITLDNDSKVAIEKLIANFGVLQLKGDVTSDKFSDVVDTSISTTQMTNLKENMTSLKGTEKAVWITSYMQGTSNYASVKCTEVMRGADGALRESSCVYDFIYKGTRWVITSYNVLSTVQLNSTEMATKNALCVCKPDEEPEINSQVGTTGATESENTVDPSNIGDVTEFEVEKPVLKDKHTKADEVSAADISDTRIATFLSDSGMLAEFNRLTGSNAGNGEEAFEIIKSHAKSAEIIAAYKELIAMNDNYVSGAVNMETYNQRVSEILSELKKISDSTKPQTVPETSENGETEQPAE